MAEQFVDSPAKLIAPIPSGNKGGPGVYDGEDGYPKRTPSPNGVPEKVRDGSMPTSQVKDGIASPGK